jgi:nitrate reductase gamma subunit
MYEFLAGPALWAAVIIFAGGMVARCVSLITLSRARDRVIYNHASAAWGLKSIVFWLIPWGSVSMRRQPVFTFAAFVFHASLLAAPLFLNAHHILFDERFGVDLWSMPDRWADCLTGVVMASGLFLLFRRVIRPEVRILTSAWDYLLLVLTLLPFITGFLAYHQWGPYDLLLVLHILFGEILLILIPFSKLSHMFLFFFTRAFIGFEMGGRRGTPAW